MQRSMSKPLMIDPGTTFACVVLSSGCTKFKYDIDIGHGITAVSHFPVELDSWWMEQLGKVLSIQDLRALVSQNGTRQRPPADE